MTIEMATGQDKRIIVRNMYFIMFKADSSFKLEQFWLCKPSLDNVFLTFLQKEIGALRVKQRTQPEQNFLEPKSFELITDIIQDVFSGDYEAFKTFLFEHSEDLKNKDFVLECLPTRDSFTGFALVGIDRRSWNREMLADNCRIFKYLGYAIGEPVQADLPSDSRSVLASDPYSLTLARKRLEDEYFKTYDPPDLTLNPAFQTLLARQNRSSPREDKATAIISATPSSLFRKPAGEDGIASKATDSSKRLVQP